LERTLDVVDQIATGLIRIGDQVERQPASEQGTRATVHGA
jgi:hypothetical protein